MTDEATSVGKFDLRSIRGLACLLRSLLLTIDACVEKSLLFLFWISSIFYRDICLLIMLGKLTWLERDDWILGKALLSLRWATKSEALSGCMAGVYASPLALGCCYENRERGGSPFLTRLPMPRDSLSLGSLYGR